MVLVINKLFIARFIYCNYQQICMSARIFFFFFLFPRICSLVIYHDLCISSFFLYCNIYFYQNEFNLVIICIIFHINNRIFNFHSHNYYIEKINLYIFKLHNFINYFLLLFYRKNKRLITS